jgi:hypothetical protein
MDFRTLAILESTRQRLAEAGWGSADIEQPTNVRIADLDIPLKAKEWIVKAAKDMNVEGNPPSWVGDEATWEKAKAAVRPKWNDYDEPYAVVTHVYKKMGGSIKGTTA